MSGKAVGVKCDFCSPAAQAKWSYPARTFAVEFEPGHVPPGFKSLGAWLACDSCADKIERDDRDAIQLCAAPGVNRNDYRRVLDGFFENRTGDRKVFG